MNLKELLKQRVDDEDLLPDLPQELKDKNTEIVKAYREGYEQGKRDAVKQGKWEYNEIDLAVGDGYFFGQGYRCSVCHKPPFRVGGTLVKTDYCPWCGSRMVEK